MSINAGGITIGLEFYDSPILNYIRRNLGLLFPCTSRFALHSLKVEAKTADTKSERRMTHCKSVAWASGYMETVTRLGNLA